ncbi:MAG: hybrid sensor histidine kinase/response regulator, partial [bacterium]|nr:hybrid sensor histidine kinase/response regulator [bacterium]
LGGESFLPKDEELINFAAFVLGVGLEKIDAERKLQGLATDLRIKGEVLTAKNVELLELDSLRSEFVSLVSHELRTPLNAIIGFSEILLDAIAGELTEKQTECVRDILGSGLHLLQIVNDILDLSKIEAGYVDLEIEKIDVKKELAAIERTLSPIISKKSQKINIVGEDGLGEIVTDKGKLTQILLNLVSNASKFSPEFSEININIKRQSDLIEFSIEDSGIGIAEKDLRLLFRPFVQIDSSHSRNYEGTGLGLVICKKMTEALGGTIRVESSPDSGSKFFFTVRDALLYDNKVVSLGKERQSFFSKFEEEVRMGRLESLLSSKLILMFKNGKSDADMLSEKLQEAGFEVVLFQDDQELLRASNMLSSDLVSLNFIHPDFDSNAIIEKLKKEPFISEVPLLVLTRDDSENVMSESMGNAVKLGKNALKDVRFFV